MKTGRKIIAYTATSADGYIARPDGDVAWLDRPGLAGDYGIHSFFRSIDTILWGRKTYDFGLRMGGLGVYGPQMKHYIFSHRPPESHPPEVEYPTEPVEKFAKRLRARAGKNVWMMGGSSLIASFLDAGGIDEFITHVIPVFIGDGIPLIQPRHRDVPLDLLASRRFPDGVVRLHYRVKRGRKA